MKNKLIIVFILLSNILIGQDRINQLKLYYTDSSELFTHSTGWAYNTSIGEWIDYENVICNDKSYKTNLKFLIGASMMSSYFQNFISVQTKTIIVEEEKYYILEVHKYVGSFDYPSIQKDWQTYICIDSYIFTQKEFEKLKDISNKKVELKTKSYVSIYQKYYDQEKFIAEIKSEILRKKSNVSREYLFPVFKADNGKVRFLIPKYYPSYESKYNFNEQYFEVDFNEFSKLIIY